MFGRFLYFERAGSIFLIHVAKSYKAKINQLWLQGIGCLKQMISLGMNTNDEMMFYKSTIQAVDIHLNRSYRNREFLERRMLLGIA